MTSIPIKHMTLYKHGVGFYVRRGQVEGEAASLVFKQSAMNDVLKSLTILDENGGQVLGVDYPTPKSREERLEGSSIVLDALRALRDLVTSLRGREVRLYLDQNEEHVGVLVGLDESPGEEVLEKSEVVLLQVNVVQTFPIHRLRAIGVLAEDALQDLKFFLETVQEKETYQDVQVRLSPGSHNLAVSYIAPSPTWRVSYRLVVPENPEGEAAVRKALLMGWGIFDNQLDEDLENISLALVAGMPVSFIYDLYTPRIPERPVVEEEDRTASAPVEFEAPVYLHAAHFAAEAAPAPQRMAKLAAPPMDVDKLAAAMPEVPVGKSLGELFEYRVATPVSVRRGQSAMVPVVLSSLDFKKDLLYNGNAFETHPVATLRLKNTTGLTLERGPVTVVTEQNYLGEAVLPFTSAENEITVPYAVELGVRVSEENGFRQQTQRLVLQGAYLVFEEWSIHWRTYQLNNSLAKPVTVLVEYPRSGQYELFDSPTPQETTLDYLRFLVEVPARGETRLKVQERRLEKRQEELRRQSYHRLQDFLRRGLITQSVHNQVSNLLRLWEQVGDAEKALAGLDQERQKIFRSQEQIRANMQALKESGKEGELRSQYVNRLASTEADLQKFDQKSDALKVEIEALKQQIEALLANLKPES